MELKKKVISSLSWSMSAKFLGQLATWGITLVVVRILSPADYGVMELAGVFVAFLAMLNELGLGAAVVHRRDMSNDALRSLFGMVLLVSVVFYLALAATAPYIADFYNEPRLVSLLRVLSLQFLLMGFTVMPQSLLLREMEFRKIAIIDFISAISGSITTLILALTGFGVWSLVWGTLMIRVLSMLGSNIARPFLCLPSANIKGMRTLFSFSGYVTLSRILWYLYSSADVIIIGKVLGKELLGYYSVGLYMASLPMDKVSGIINQVAFPAFSTVQSDTGLAGKHFLKAIRVMSFITFPVLWGISSVAPEFVGIFLGSKWSNATLPLQMIALVIPLRMVGNLMATAALGVGRPDISVLNALVAFALMPLAFVFGSLWGLLGVSLAWVLVFPLVFSLNLVRVLKLFDIHSSEVVQAIKMPFISGLTMYCGVMFVREILTTGIQIIPKLVILVVSGVCIYTIMTLIFNRIGLQEVRALAKA